MDVIDHLEDCPRHPDGCAVTIGNFDGVHKGHREIIRDLRLYADGAGASTAAVTFTPHTLQVLRPEVAPLLLSSLDRKLELLAATGLDYTMLLTFDEKRALQSAEDFVRQVLVDCLHAKVVMVGEDFRFGHHARGSIALLREMGEEHGFRVEPVPVITGRLGVYSSTNVRKAVVEGRMEDAAEMLGRPHELRGEVVHGDQRGRQLGFPTANVVPEPRVCLPPNGVYASRVRVLEDGTGAWHDAVTNFGTRPTFRATGVGPQPIVEAHLLGFSGDLYGKIMDVAFVERLREERRFDSAEALEAQIEADVAAAAALLHAEGR